ncbi:MAG TPA: Hsp20/alpha crystallin family protein [bacterium]|nr:Hsp20/alpha crystallin family protein [bacterium]
MSTPNPNPFSQLFQKYTSTPPENHQAGKDEDGQLIVDMSEDDESYFITAPAAGVQPEDLEIELNDDYIIIKGSRRQDNTPHNRHYLFQECYWGSFTRQIDFPTTTDSEKAVATFKEGMLHISIPKAKSQKTRTLKIKTI